MIFTSSTFLYTWIHTFKDKKKKKERVKELTVPSLCSSFKLKKRRNQSPTLWYTVLYTWCESTYRWIWLWMWELNLSGKKKQPGCKRAFGQLMHEKEKGSDFFFFTL